MKIVFDMSTGEVLEDCQAVQRQECHGIANAYHLPELRLQLLNQDCRDQRRIPPEPVIVDLSAFLQKMC